MEEFQELLNFLGAYGRQISIFAVMGIAILGILKYCNIFKNFSEAKRHYLYLAISVGFTLVAVSIFLIVNNAFTWEYLCTVSAAVYTLNQAFYNLFKVTPINDLFTYILDFIKNLFSKKDVKSGEISSELVEDLRQEIEGGTTTSTENNETNK